MGIIRITSEKEYSNFIDNKETGIVKYTASWCQPCKKIAPLYKELSDKYQNLNFFEIDLDSEAGMNCNVQSVPTFIFIKNGEMYAEIVGCDKNLLVSKTEIFNSNIST